MKKITLILVALIAGAFAMQLNAESDFSYFVEVENFDGWNDLTIAHPAHIWGYYEHPYGQESYIEYMVDETWVWTRIETPLTSGEEYNLDFEMMFNPDEITTHTLSLRLNDGMDNNLDLQGLTWTDVRSYDVSGLNNRVYNGQPQEFNVTVNGETNTYVGGTNPGTYYFTINGDYEQNTIGVMEVEYTIEKATPVIRVTPPNPLIAYDGASHGATVVVVTGDGTPVITYMKTADGSVLTEAPSAVGVYTVIVEMPETEFYYGIEPTSYGTFEIYGTITGLNEIAINGKDNGAWYTIDGRRVAAPAERGIYIHNGKKYIVK